MNTSLVRSSPIVQIGRIVTPGLVERDEHQRDAAVLVVRVGAGAEPVPLGEVRGRRPRLLPVQQPAAHAVPLGALGLEPHRRGVGAGVRLAVADRELDLVAQDHRQELLLQEVVAVRDEGLADDADALADLRAAPPRERLVEQVLVDALALGAAVLLRPGHPEPAPRAELGHERPALRRVDDLGHVLPGEVEHVRVVVLVEEHLDLLGERLLLGGEVEVHGPYPCWSTPDLTGRQIRRRMLREPDRVARRRPERRRRYRSLGGQRSVERRRHLGVPSGVKSAEVSAYTTVGAAQPARLATTARRPVSSARKCADDPPVAASTTPVPSSPSVGSWSSRSLISPLYVARYTGVTSTSGAAVDIAATASSTLGCLARSSRRVGIEIADVDQLPAAGDVDGRGRECVGLGAVATGSR